VSDNQSDSSEAWRPFLTEIKKSNLSDIDPTVIESYPEILPERSKIYEGLYMGSFPMTDTSEFDLVVSLSRRSNDMIASICKSYLHFPFYDSPMIPNPKILRYLAELIANFVDFGENVLVHCDAGLNRSGMVCALVLIELNFKPQDAINLLRKQRCNEVLYNGAFRKYIMEQA